MMMGAEDGGAVGKWFAEGTRAAVLTISDGCSRGEREDRSGPAVAELLEQVGIAEVMTEIFAG